MDIRYQMVIYWSIADNGFIVEVPELPGCMADGKTYTEAVNNAQKVIKEWIESANLLNRPIPLPKNRIAT